MEDNKNFLKNLLSLFRKAVENKTYGSVEIFFEAGKITQITERVINKIHHKVERPAGESILEKTGKDYNRSSSTIDSNIVGEA